jgi:hypothetical protein
MKTRTVVYPAALVQHPALLSSYSLLGWLYRRDVEVILNTAAPFEVPDDIQNAIKITGQPTPPWYLTGYQPPGA